MKETFSAAKDRPALAGLRQYEYLVMTISPHESLPTAHQRLRDHAEYGKWELQRSRLYMGGGRQYWLRRRIFRVERTY